MHDPASQKVQHLNTLSVVWPMKFWIYYINVQLFPPEDIAGQASSASLCFLGRTCIKVINTSEVERITLDRCMQLHEVTVLSIKSTQAEEGPNVLLLTQSGSWFSSAYCIVSIKTCGGWISSVVNRRAPGEFWEGAQWCPSLELLHM